MNFDSNKAWLDAVAAVKANREVLLPVAGVFFLLPTLLSTVFLADTQMQILGAMGKPEALQRIVADHLGLILGFGIGGLLVQGVGMLAVMALLSDHARPTVGEAIFIAIRTLPTLIGSTLLLLVGTFLASLLLGLVIGGLFGALLGTAVASTMVAVAAVMLMTYVSVKVSLLVPVVVSEGIGSPVSALARSWRLTRGNSLRLFGFYTLLTVGYMLVAFVATLLAVGPAALLLREGQALTLFTGVVSGLIGALTSVILIAILAQAHRQLAGPSAEAISRTFE